MSKKYLMAMLIVFVIFFCVPILPVAGLSKSVSVTLPNFSVMINGTMIKNSNRQYPFIVYQDITYFPMTYYDCRALGVETDWDVKEGLSIEKTGVVSTYTEAAAGQNKTNFTAQIASFPMKVNGKAVDNGKEPYPLLSFRDVTYFPMSWKYAVDCFGWSYHFDSSNGLTINSNGNSVEKLEEITEGVNEMVIAKGYLYYYENGKIISLNYNDPSDKKIMHQFVKDSNGKYPDIQSGIRNGEPYFRALQIGDLSAPRETYYVNTDKRTSQLMPEDIAIFGDAQIIVADSQGQEPGNLSVKFFDRDIKKIGDPKLHYQVEFGYSTWAASREGDNLVLLAFGEDRIYDLCKVDLNTGSNTILAENVSTGRFVVDNGYAYVCYSPDGVKLELGKISLTDGKLTNLKVKSSEGMEAGIFDVLHGKVYYKNGFNPDRPHLMNASEAQFKQAYEQWFANRFKYDEELYTIGSDISLTPGITVSNLFSSGEYMVVLFDYYNDKMETDNKYTLMVYDKNGEVVFRTSDQVFYAYVDGNIMIYRTNTNLMVTDQISTYKVVLR